MADVGRGARAMVVGYGNDLRTDDGAGRWVADAIEAMALDAVDVRSVSQLTPEVAIELAGRRLVIFVDASVDVDALTVTPVVANTDGAQTMTHHGDPAVVLSMVPQIGDPPGAAWLVSIPATDLNLGLAMTPATRTAAAEAVDRIMGLIENRSVAAGSIGTAPLPES